MNAKAKRAFEVAAYVPNNKVNNNNNNNDATTMPTRPSRDKAEWDNMRKRVEMVRARVGRSAVFDVRTAVDIWDVAWETAVPQQLSTAERGHTSTIFFVPFADGAKVVVKMSDNVVSECLGAAIARQLGIAAPEVRFVARTEDEFARISRVLESGAESTPELAGRVRKALQFKGLLLVQFVRGTTLDEALFKSRTLHRKTLEALGRTLLLDMVLRNTDRMPLMFDHPGNLGNIMLQEMSFGPPRVVAIDNTPAVLRDGAGRDGYLEQVGLLLDSVLSNSADRVDPSFARVATCMGLQGNKEAILHMQRGFVEDLPRVGRTTFLDEALEFVSGIGGDNEFWAEQSRALDVSFFRDVISVTQRALQKHSPQPTDAQMPE